jgi:hypothetical protein
LKPKSTVLVLMGTTTGRTSTKRTTTTGATIQGATIKVAPTIVGLLLAALVVTALIYQLPTAQTIDVGSGQDAPFIEGFSFRENFDGGALRWTGHAAELRFWGVGAQAGMLALRLNVPPQNGTRGVEVWANERLLDTVHPAPGWNELEFPIAQRDIGWSGDLSVRLVSETFTAPPDTRPLGVQVDRAQFVGKGAPVLPAPNVLIFMPALAVLVFGISSMWSGRRGVGIAASLVAITIGALGLAVARVETAYFSGPLLGLGLVLVLGALVLAELLQRLTGALGAPPLAARTLRWIFVAMLVAFAFRLFFATGPGYIVDTQDYVVWSYKTVTYGLGTMYAAVDGLWISDQSPGLNYILHVMGLLYRAIFAPDFLYPAVAGDPALRGLSTNPALLADPVQRTLLRLPMLLADVLTGAVIFAVARKYVSEWGAWLVALGYWFNPAVLWNGAYWGQTDALHTFLVLVAFVLLVFARRAGLAFFLVGIAALVKPQAMIFGPLLLLGAYRVASWRGMRRAVGFGAFGAALVLLPVVLTGGTQGLLAYFGDTVGHHPILSANAHNLWWFLYHGNIDVPDTGALVPGAPLSYRAFSILLFGVVYLLALAKAWRAPLEEWFALGAFLAFGFFMLPTEIHENYGFALLALLAVALARDRTWLLFYVSVSVTMTLNYALHDPGLFARFSLSDPDREWAAARWWNASANLLLLAAWTIRLFWRPAAWFRPEELKAQGMSQ